MDDASTGGKNTIAVRRHGEAVETHHFVGDIALWEGGLIEIHTAFGECVERDY
ncbi:MAG: hypothetical protein ABJR46_06000 [Tateyamaria sp.]|uniref:hypothetical protein n=1 Tax=Tateyamaria sp. TaxID=1929288 RepID=UPI00329108D0